MDAQLSLGLPESKDGRLLSRSSADRPPTPAPSREGGRSVAKLAMSDKKMAVSPSNFVLASSCFALVNSEGVAALNEIHRDEAQPRGTSATSRLRLWVSSAALPLTRRVLEPAVRVAADSGSASESPESTIRR